MKATRNSFKAGPAKHCAMSSGPYKPTYKGFNEKEAQQALDTVDRANEAPSGIGEYVDAEYMELGPEEAARRLGWTRKHLDEAFEHAMERKEHDS